LKVNAEISPNNLMDAEEYRAIQLALLLRPEMGPVIRRSAGLRKIRWAVKGTDK